MKLKPSRHRIYISLSTAICATTILLICPRTQAQNLFESYFPSASRNNPNYGGIAEYTPSGTQSILYSDIYAAGLAFNNSGNLFVADYYTGGSIYKLNASGGLTAFATGLSFPFGLAFNTAGNLFESDQGSGNIYEFTPGGVKSTFATGLDKPYQIAFNGAGNLFVADDLSGNIYEYTPGGVRSTFASGLNHPVGIAINSAGDVFEGDYDSGIINEFTPGGVKTTFATGVPLPFSLAFNDAGDLFEVGWGGTIDEFTPSGAQSNFATGLANGDYLAFAPVSEPVPPAFSLMAVGIIALFVRRRRKQFRYAVNTSALIKTNTPQSQAKYVSHP